MQKAITTIDFFPFAVFYWACQLMPTRTAVISYECSFVVLNLIFFFFFLEVICFLRGNDGYIEGANIVPETRIIITTKNNATLETII